MKGNAHHAYDRGGIVYVYGYIDGKICRRSTGLEANAANMAYAAREWRELLRSKGKSTTAQSTSANSVKEFGLESLKANGVRRKEITNEDYERLFMKEIVPVFGDRDISSLTPFELKSWLYRFVKKDAVSGKVTGAAKAGQLKKIFHSILNDAVLQELIQRNPLDNIAAINAKQREANPLSLEEAKKLLSVTKGWFRDFLIVSLFTGMRTGEAMALKWADINFENKRIAINATRTRGRLGDPKTPSSKRAIDMLPAVEKALKRQYERSYIEGGFVFTNRKGNGFKSSWSLRRYWKDALNIAGLEYRDLYQTRHSFATIMISESKRDAILWVSKMLGHKNPKITWERYARHIPSERAGIADFLGDLS